MCTPTQILFTIQSSIHMFWDFLSDDRDHPASAHIGPRDSKGRILGKEMLTGPLPRSVVQAQHTAHLARESGGGSLLEVSGNTPDPLCLVFSLLSASFWLPLSWTLPCSSSPFLRCQWKSAEVRLPVLDCDLNGTLYLSVSSLHAWLWAGPWGGRSAGCDYITRHSPFLYKTTLTLSPPPVPPNSQNDHPGETDWQWIRSEAGWFPEKLVCLCVFPFSFSRFSAALTGTGMGTGTKSRAAHIGSQCQSPVGPSDFC